ncbi:hypothetical protein WS71_31055 [Burkholderia mayonis]|uniref:Uncharacterized protein n=1 Tax=Burkholderia mayonis TaxID=1385591 RepID=A0A1B4G6F3_9BURK|nr:hypothetical protein WS71_31055 [Burkholderia mayonis]KVE46469.1 hypothetical protein WS71_22215 [Burkholderia mayonis]
MQAPAGAGARRAGRAAPAAGGRGGGQAVRLGADVGWERGCGQAIAPEIGAPRAAGEGGQ